MFYYAQLLCSALQSSKKILIVDDHPDIVDIIYYFITLSCDQTFKIYKASDGKEALTIVKKDRPDLIFLDLHMPVMNGFEVCQTLKSDDNFSDIPIVIVSAYLSKENIDRIISLGADMFIKKPIEIEELFGAIEKFVTNRTTH